MNWIVWGIIAFVILCGACALAFEWAGRHDQRENANDDIGQRSSPSR